MLQGPNLLSPKPKDSPRQSGCVKTPRLSGCAMKPRVSASGNNFKIPTGPEEKTPIAPDCGHRRGTVLPPQITQFLGSTSREACTKKIPLRPLDAQDDSSLNKHSLLIRFIEHVILVIYIHYYLFIFVPNLHGKIFRELPVAQFCYI